MRLIDADAMKTDVIYQTAFLSLLGGEVAELAEILKKGIVKEIEKAPTIDAMPVVRCKDCKHYWKNSKYKSNMEDMEDVAMCLASPSDDAFCSEGEREE